MSLRTSRGNKGGVVKGGVAVVEDEDVEVEVGKVEGEVVDEDEEILEEAGNNP